MNRRGKNPYVVDDADQQGAANLRAARTCSSGAAWQGAGTGGAAQRGVKLLARTLAFRCGALALAAQWGADRVSARAARSCAAGEG